MALRIKNWEKFQHYRNRKPPWIRLYNDLLDDPDFDELTGDLAKLLIKLWLVASEHGTDGSLPDMRTLALKLRIASNLLAEHLRQLNHWVECDDSDMLATCTQHARPETEGETEGYQRQRESERQARAREFDLFWKSYPNKKSKGQAERTWKKLSLAKTLPHIDVLLDAIAKQKEHREQCAQANQWVEDWAHPSTWLNASKWDDELIQVRHKPSPQHGSIDFLRREMEEQ